MTAVTVLYKCYVYVTVVCNSIVNKGVKRPYAVYLLVWHSIDFIDSGTESIKSMVIAIPLDLIARADQGSGLPDRANFFWADFQLRKIFLK